MWYLIRHPETQLNAQHRYHGWPEVGLSVKGYQQVKLISEIVQKLSFDLILSSDLARCLNLAQKIKQINSIKLCVSSQLRELNFGAWHGRTFSEIQKSHPEVVDAWIKNPDKIAPPQGETLHEMRTRCLRFLKAYEAVNTLIITHGGIIAAILSDYCGVDFWEAMPKNGNCIALDLNTRQYHYLK